MSTQETIDANKKEADKEEENKRKLESIKWQLDDDPPSDAIVLEINDEIIGTIMGKEEVTGIHKSKQMKYDFHVVGEDEARPLYCSTDLKRRLAAVHGIGDFVKIKRIEDKPRTSPEKNPMHVFEVYSPKED